MATSRFTIHIPTNTQAAGLLMSTAGKEDQLLDTVRDTLTAAGIHGRHVEKNVEHDLGHERSSSHLIHVDAEDDEATRNVLKTVAEGIKALSGHKAIYITVHPIESWLI